jgi:hypothetical protein
MKELLISVAGGLVVGILMEFIRGWRKPGTQVTPALQAVDTGVRVKNSNGRWFVRLVLSLMGGLALAFIAGRQLLHSGGGVMGVAGLTIAGTLVFWMLLSAISGRK